MNDETASELAAEHHFSAVWTQEFNKKLERVRSTEEGGKESQVFWKEDSYPWKQLWCSGSDSSFVSDCRNLVPLKDAFEELHDCRLAYTVPGVQNSDGSNQILDHMCASVRCTSLLLLDVNFLQLSHSRASATYWAREHGAMRTTSTKQRYRLPCNGYITLAPSACSVSQVQASRPPIAQRASAE
jgi:hypothetical protein